VASEQDPPAESGPPDHEGSDSGSHPDGGETPKEPTLSDEPSPSGGSIRFQDPATTQRRPLTVGEDRALDKAIRKTQESEQARFAAEEARFAAEAKRRRLIGGAAVVGVVGLVAATALQSPNRVTAQCVQDDSDGQQVIAPDSYCTGQTAGYNGFFFYSGHSYRYYYGSVGSIGSPPDGGTTVAPRGATITTGSGTTIQRGGLGSRFSGGGSGS
jgi:hypothetical protein